MYLGFTAKTYTITSSSESEAISMCTTVSSANDISSFVYISAHKIRDGYLSRLYNIESNMGEQINSSLCWVPRSTLNDVNATYHGTAGLKNELPVVSANV